MTDSAEGTAVLSDEERAQVVEAIYRGRIRNCEETVENWPGEDTLLCRVLRAESERFVRDAEPALTTILAARAALPGTADECVGCPPCPGRGNDGHGMTHCAECCFGTHVEADPTCPVHGEAAYPRTADTGAREAVIAAVAATDIKGTRSDCGSKGNPWHPDRPSWWRVTNPEDFADAALVALAATPDGHQHAAEES